MKKELYNEIDLCVSELINRGVISENFENSDLRKESIRYLKANNFLKPAKSRFQYHPSFEIYDIEKVGIEQFLKNRESDNKTESDIKRKTLFDLNNKYFINFIFLVFGALLGWFLKNTPLKKEEKHTGEKLHKVISEKNDSLIQIQTDLTEKNKRIFSLRKQLDSLKKK
jgi:hypothetical protein